MFKASLSWFPVLFVFGLFSATLFNWLDGMITNTALLLIAFGVGVMMPMMVLILFIYLWEFINDRY